MARIWRMSEERTGIGGKRKRRGDFWNGALLFAIILVLVIVALTFIFVFNGAGENTLLLLALLAPVGVVAACLIFVRANMSWVIIFFQVEGRMFRLMSCNTDISPAKYIKGAVDKEDLKGHKPYIAELAKFVGKDQIQIMQITGVESIYEMPRNFIVRCQILFRNRLRRKKLRIIKNYDDMDALIGELELLKGRSEEPGICDTAQKGKDFTS